MRGHSRSKASIRALVRQLPGRTHIEINACGRRKVGLGYLDARAYITVIYMLDG